MTNPAPSHLHSTPPLLTRPAVLSARIRGMFNLNDGKWGRSDGAGDANAPAGTPAGTPSAGPSQSPPPPPPLPPSSPPSSPPPAPSSGRGNNPSGPPDLDELWRDFNNKLGGLFGGGGNNRPPQRPNNNGGNSGGGGFQPPSGKAAGIGLAVAASVVGLIWLGTGFYVVQEGQQGVITRFGKFKGNETGGLAGAGFNWRLPYPFENHEIVSVSQTRSVEVGRNSAVQNTGLKDSSILTQDENIVDMKFVVQYRIKDAADFLFNNVGATEAVVLAAESAVREVVGKGSLNVVLNEKRESIASDIVKSVQAQLDLYKTGILISSVNIQNVQPPEQVQAAFDDALKAGQDGDRAKNEGQAYANDVVPRAEGRASRLKEEAEGYKARVTAQAEGDGQRFKSILVEYQKAPQVTRDRMYLDAMQQIFSSTTKILVDSRSGNNLLSLPLDRLLQQGSGPVSVGAAADAAPASIQNAVPAAPTSAPSDARTRDDARARARDSR